MRVNADSLLIRAATTSTSVTLNDLTTALIMANNNITAPLFLQLLIALVTWSLVSDFTRLILLAICLGEVWGLYMYVIPSFSAVSFDFPSIPLMVRHNLVLSVLWSKLSTNYLHCHLIIRSRQLERGEVLLA